IGLRTTHSTAGGSNSSRASTLIATAINTLGRERRASPIPRPIRITACRMMSQGRGMLCSFSLSACRSAWVRHRRLLRGEPTLLHGLDNSISLYYELLAQQSWTGTVFPCGTKTTRRHKWIDKSIEETFCGVLGSAPG